MQRSKAVYTQYITLMLILVSFLVASYAKKATTSGKFRPATTEDVSAPIKPSDVFTLKDIFKSDNLPDIGQIEAIASILKGHDVLAEIRVYPSPDIDRDGSINSALDRTIALSKELRRLGVNPEVFHAYACSDERGDEIEVRLYHA